MTFVSPSICYLSLSLSACHKKRWLHSKTREKTMFTACIMQFQHYINVVHYVSVEHVLYICLPPNPKSLLDTTLNGPHICINFMFMCFPNKCWTFVQSALFIGSLALSPSLSLSLNHFLHYTADSNVGQRDRQVRGRKLKPREEGPFTISHCLKQCPQSLT